MATYRIRNNHTADLTFPGGETIPAKREGLVDASAIGDHPVVAAWVQGGLVTVIEESAPAKPGAASPQPQDAVGKQAAPVKPKPSKDKG